MKNAYNKDLNHIAGTVSNDSHSICLVFGTMYEINEKVEM